MAEPIYRDSCLWEEKIGETSLLGDRYDWRRGSLILTFTGPRHTVSTSPLHGGIREDLRAVFNANLQALTRQSELRAPDYRSELELIGQELGLQAPYTGLATAAWTERAVSASVAQSGLAVEVIATGGVARNAVAAGDPGTYCESLDEPGRFQPIGTINLIISSNVKLAPGPLCKAVITVTEAKSAALLELDLSSSQTYDYATGSGTDGVILISDPAGPELTDCGTHSEFGAVLAQAVKRAVRRAILVNTGHATPDAHSVAHLIARYQMDILTVYRLALRGPESPLGRDFWHLLKSEGNDFQPETMAAGDDFSRRFRAIDSDSASIIFTTLYLHLLDRHRHGLIEWGEVFRESMNLLATVLEKRYNRKLPLEQLQPLHPIEISEMKELLEVILLYLMSFESIV